MQIPYIHFSNFIFYLDIFKPIVNIQNYAITIGLCIDALKPSTQQSRFFNFIKID